MTSLCFIPILVPLKIWSLWPYMRWELAELEMRRLLTNCRVSFTLFHCKCCPFSSQAPILFSVLWISSIYPQVHFLSCNRSFILFSLGQINCKSEDQETTIPPTRKQAKASEYLIYIVLLHVHHNIRYRGWVWTFVHCTYFVVFRIKFMENVE